MQVLLGIVAVIGGVVCIWVNHAVNNGTLARLINSNVHGVTVSYASCSGSIFTQFHFKELRVEGEDSSSTWQLQLNDMVIAPTIWRLPLKQLYSRMLFGTGVSFQLAFKPPNADSTVGPENYKNNWRFSFAKIDLEQISEITIGSLSYKGGASLHSGLYLWPGTEIRIDPSRFQAIGPTLEADLNFRVDPIRFSGFAGSSLLHALSAQLKLNGEYPNLKALNYRSHALPWLTVSGEDARFSASIGIEKGLVTQASRAELDLRNLIVKVGQVTAVGAGTIKYAESKLDVQLRHYQLSPLAISGDRLDFAALAKKIDLANPLEDLQMFFELAPTKISELGVLTPYLHNFPSIKIRKGSAEVSARLQFATATGNVSGRIEGVTRDLEIAIAGSTIKTNVRLEASLAREVSTVNLDFTEFGISAEKHKGRAQLKNWWGHVVVSDARLRLGASNVFSGVAHLTGRDGKPFLFGLMNAGELPIDITKVSAMNDLSVTSGIHIDNEAAHFKDFRLKSTTLNARGHLEFKDGRKFGVLKIHQPEREFEIDISAP